MVEDPTSLLRRKGLQVTAQRVAVLRAVAMRPHCTAEQVADDVRAAIGAISRQAVYDAVGVLTKAGLIRRIQPAASPALFDPRVGDGHHHAICRLCGTIMDVDCEVVEAPGSSLPGAMDFQIHEVEVTYWGACATCASGRMEPSRGGGSLPVAPTDFAAEPKRAPDERGI